VIGVTFALLLGLLAVGGGLVAVTRAAPPAQRGTDSPCGCGATKTVSPGAIRLCETSQVTVTFGATCPDELVHIVLIIDEDWKPDYSDPKVRTAALRDAVLRLEMDQHPNIRVGVVWMQRGSAQRRVDLTNDARRVIDNLDIPTLPWWVAALQCFDCGFREAVRILDRAEAEAPKGSEISEIVILAPLGVYMPDAAPGLASGARLARSRGATVITSCFAWTHCHQVLREAASAARFYLAYGEGPRLGALLYDTVRTSVALFVREVRLVDVLPPEVALVPGSLQPPPSAVDPASGAMRWVYRTPDQAVYTVTYRIQPLALGSWSLADGAAVGLTDSAYRIVTATLPSAVLTVTESCDVPPTATPPPTATATPPWTATATPPPTDTATAPPPPTATPTPLPRPAYLPLALNERCVPLRVATDVALAIDMSTSMRQPLSSGGSTLDAARTAARLFVGAMDLTPDAAGRSDRVAVIGFNREAWIQQPLTNDAAALERAIDALAIHIREHTRLDLAFARGAEALAGGRPDSSAVLVVLTDGLPNQVPYAEDGTMATTVLRAAQAAKDAQITVYTVGVGPGRIDADLLRAAASRPEMFFLAPDAAQLAGIYRQLTRVIPCGHAVFWPARP
jgi:Mg-chelatase subunit ChlD